MFKGANGAMCRQVACLAKGTNCSLLSFVLCYLLRCVLAGAVTFCSHVVWWLCSYISQWCRSPQAYYVAMAVAKRQPFWSCALLHGAFLTQHNPSTHIPNPMQSHHCALLLLHVQDDDDKAPKATLDDKKDEDDEKDEL